MIVQSRKEGHRICELYPIYKFDKPEILDSFIQKVRERHLQAKFQPSWIYLDHRSNSIARSKVVRLWEKEEIPGLRNAEITLTFLTTSLKQEELDLNDYELAIIPKESKTGIFSKGSKDVELRRKPDAGVLHSETFTFSFPSPKGKSF